MEKEIPMNLKFIEFMHTLGDAKCLIINGQCFTYRNVVDGIQRWDSEFYNYGITQGSVAALEGAYSLDMVTAMLALFLRGVIVIPYLRTLKENELTIMR
jgi:acyl-CoA synthetase (AMP-forming)/AMP-acid ligase II